MGYNVTYIIHCSVFTQSMVFQEFVIFEISLKKNVFRLGTGNRQMEKSEMNFSTVHLPPVHIQRKKFKLVKIIICLNVSVENRK